MIPSRREYARQLGTSEARLRRAEQDGRVEREPDGTLDLAKAAAALAAAQNPARAELEAVGLPRRGRGVVVRDAVHAALLEPPPSPPPPAAAPSAPDRLAPMSFNDARTANENFRAQLARLDLMEREGRLVNVDAARETYQTLSRKLRDAVLLVPTDLAARLSAISDELVIERLLRAALEVVLTQAAEDAARIAADPTAAEQEDDE